MPKVGERYIIELSEELKSADDKYYMIKGIGNTMISTYEVSRLKLDAMEEGGDTNA